MLRRDDSFRFLPDFNPSRDHFCELFKSVDKIFCSVEGDSDEVEIDSEIHKIS